MVSDKRLLNILFTFFRVVMQSNQPHTFVVVILDPPIRKGQTMYRCSLKQIMWWKAR
ncbi:hypothetical protein HanLR1_Chr16g0636411 [Helianthus annuus]|nr:hypothetical protein HanLR1_Chr16g0636411 [Helianthus annuus]